jgi:L-iditol 2-dehydrogenase
MGREDGEGRVQVIMFMTTVKALECTGINKLVLREFPMPVIPDDCVLLRITSCGVCGTDLHGIQGKRSLKFPVIPGHEVVSVVEQIGKGADRIKVFGGKVSAGDRVTLNPRIVCGECYYCLNLPSRPEMCTGARTYNSSIGSADPPHLFGGWSEYMVILPGSELIKIPEGLPDNPAVLAEPLACAVGCVDRYRNEHDWVCGDGFGINRSVVICGVGAIGILMAAAFRLAGAGKIIAVDVDEKRLQISEKFGVNYTINVQKTSKDDRVKKIRDLTDGLGASICIEACGNPQMLSECIYYLRRGGKLFEIGHLVKTPMAEVDPLFVCRNEIEILGHYAYPSSSCLEYAAKILHERKFPYEELVKIHPLENYNEVIFGGKIKEAVKSAFLP